MRFVTSGFFHESVGFNSHKMPKIAEVKLSSCRLEVVDFRKNFDCSIAELRLRINTSLKTYGNASFKLRNCDYELKKKLRLPTSG
jgi:hypothetical protein